MRIPQAAPLTFSPFKQELKEYSWGFLRDDLFAALAVALTTIPQSIAYAMLAGLPPMAGLFSAIFGTIFTAAFGSSRHLISGPSTGVAILIQTSINEIHSDYFSLLTGPAKDAMTLHLLGQIVLIMGLIQIAAAYFNVSKLLQFVSRPVVLGYFAGIMVSILVSQLYYFFNIRAGENDVSLLYKAASLFLNIWKLDWVTTLIGAVSLLLLLLLKRQKRVVPDALLVLIAASLLSYGLTIWLGESATPTLQHFGFTEKPSPELQLPFIDFKLLNKIFPAASAIAFLAILEVFSISRSFGAKSGQVVQINQDVAGLGAGNLVLSALAGAMPCSGSVSRTSINYRLKAKTRFAAIFSGLLTAAIVGLLWPLVQLIPLCALAALLIATVPNLIDYKEMKLIVQATREDRWVFGLTVFSCLIFSLDIAFFVGIVMSIGTYLRKSAIPHLVEYAFNSKGRLIIVSPKDDVHRKVRIIGISGDLYFAATDIFQTALHAITEDPNVQAIVLRLNNVYHMDATMCLAIQRLHETLVGTQRYLVISGLTEEVWHVFHRAGLVKQIGLDNLYFTDESNPQFSTWKACLHAQEMLHRHAR